MNKELTDKIKRESLNILILVAVGVVLFKIVFYKENLMVVLRTVTAFFWLFVIPGFYLMYYWHEKLDFLERFLIGMALSGSIIGIASYYISLLGLNIKYHIILLPLVCLIAAGVVVWRKK